MDAAEPSGRQGSKRGEIVAWIAAAVVGAAAFFGLYSLAIPEASVDFSLTREEALTAGRAFLDGRGYELSGYESAVDFSWNPSARNYLEKELTLREANAVMADEPGVWFWRCRWFQPEVQEEFRVWFSPDGRLVNFQHIIPETEPRAELSEEAARAAAESLLRSLGLDLAAYELTDSSSQERAARTDRYFTWENRDRAGDADAYLYVEFYGDELGMVNRGLEVPETWLREQQRRSAWRSFLTQVAEMFHFVLQGAMLLLCVSALRSRHAAYGAAVKLGLVVGAVAAADAANRLTQAWMYYPTTKAPGAFLGEIGLDVLGDFLRTLLVTFILAMAATRIQQDVFPRQVPIGAMFSRPFWRCKRIVAAFAVGYALFLCHLGYFAAFYVGGKEFLGVWAGQETPYSNLLASPLPFLAPITTGLTASVYEELLFRLVAIALLLRFTGSRALAVFVPALIWGFLHSNYPQEPFYIRGLELTLVGIVYGCVFLRYGIAATLLSHFAYNACMASVVLFGSDDTFLQASGWVVAGVIAAPILPGLYHRLRHGYWAVEPSHAPHVEHVLPVREESPAQFLPVTRYSKKRYAAFSLMALTGIFTTAFAMYSDTWMGAELSGVRRVLGLPAPAQERESLYGPIVMSQSRDEAEVAARDWLAGQGIDTGAWRAAVAQRNQWGATEMAYLYETAGQEKWRVWTERFLPHRSQWHVRFFQPLRAEEYNVYIGADGEVVTYYHSLPDEAPGANLSLAEARGLAEEHLATNHGLELSLLRLVEERSQERDGRTDHYFVWERRGFFVPAVSFRVMLRVYGDEVHGFSPFVHVPEEWRREQARRTTWDLAVDILTVIFMIIVGAPLGYVCLLMALQRAIAWKAWFFPALLFTVPQLIDQLNALPGIWTGYDTDTEPALFLARYYIALIQGLGLAFLINWIVASVVHALFRRAFPERLPWRDWFSPTRLAAQNANFRAVWSDGVLAGGMLALGFLALMAFVAFAQRISQLDVRAIPLVPNPVVVFPGTTAFPFLDEITGLAITAIVLPFVLAFLAAYYKLFLRQGRWLVLVLAVFLVLGRLESFEVQSGLVMLLSAVFAAAAIALGLFAVPRLVGHNGSTVVAFGLAVGVLDAAPSLLLNPDGASRFFGVALLIAFCCVMAFAAHVRLAKVRS